VAAAAPAADPHEAVQESEAFIASLHGKVDAVLVAGRVDTICKTLVVNFFEDVLGAGEPTFSLDHDESRWLFRGLKHVVGAELGSLVLGDNLGILTARLDWTLAIYYHI